MNRKKLMALLMLPVLLCPVLFGCGSVNDDSSDRSKEESSIIKSENGAVVSVSIHENGSEDGRNIQWEVYEEDGKYIVSYHDEPDAPEVYEVTEEEYRDVMSCEYDKYIAEYDPNIDEDIKDAMHYDSTVRYENGKEVTTKASMYYPCERLYKIRNSYKK